MIFEIRYSDESAASVLVEAPDRDAAVEAFGDMDPSELRAAWLERTDAGSFVVERVEEAGWAAAVRAGLPAAGEIDRESLLAAYLRWKDRIDDAHAAGDTLPGEDGSFSAGDTLIALRHPACAVLAEARGDFLDSSAEVAAFAFAMDELGYI